MSRDCLATLWLNGWMQKGTGRKPNTLELLTIGGVPAMKEELQVKNAVSTTLILNYLLDDLMPRHRQSGLRDFSLLEFNR